MKASHNLEPVRWRFFHATRSFVGHENTRRWMVQCYKGL